MGLSDEAAVCLPRRGCPFLGKVRPVCGGARESATRLTRDPPSHRVVPVGDVESQFPNAVSIGVRFPLCHFWSQASKRTQSCGSSMPQLGSRRRVQVPQSFFKSSVIHNLSDVSEHLNDAVSRADANALTSENELKRPSLRTPKLR